MIEVETQDKIRFAKNGANKLFKVDYEKRKSMSDQQLIELFDEVWLNRLKPLVSIAKSIDYEEVTRRLHDKHQTFIDRIGEHRSFHYDKAEFIVQLQLLSDNQYRLTQLWRVKSSDTYPATLFVNFDSVEERDRFKVLAEDLGWKDDKLGLKLIRHFMDLHPSGQTTRKDDI